MRMKNQHRRFRAFTLLELLVALALTATLFVALMQFAFSMAELWGQGERRRQFERHASAVTFHLQGLITTATSRLSPAKPVAITGNVSTAGDSELVTLELPEGDRVFRWPDRSMPDVVCGVQARPEEGLLLRWVSRQEPGFEGRNPRTVILSPFGEDIEYEYHDKTTHSWRTYGAPQKDAQGEWQLPARLKIHFRRGKFRAERTVVIPPRQVAVPVF